jgi:hypothetical protein
MMTTVRAPRLDVLFLATLAFGGAAAYAQTCSSQAITPGTYYIRSVHPDSQPRYLERRSQDSNSIQFYFADAGSDEKFEFAVGNLGSGCYRIRTVYDGTSDPHYLNAVVGGLPGLALLIEADDGNLKSYYWRIIQNANRTYSFINELNDESPNQQCMNRRTPDDAGRAQVLQCDFGNDFYQFYLEATSAKTEKQKNKPDAGSKK